MFHTPRLFSAALGLLIAAGTAAVALAPSADAVGAVTAKVAAPKLPTVMHLEVLPHTLEAYFGWVGTSRPTGKFTFLVDGTPVGSASVPSKAPSGIDLHGFQVIASSAYTIPNGKAHKVEARYAGDATYAPVAQSLTRTDPKIKALVKSSVSMTKYGWYRAPVTVSFVCVKASGNIVCPKPAHFDTSGADQWANGIMVASDGGRAHASKYVNLDLARPTVSMIRLHGTPMCHGSDALSGLARCTLSKSVKKGKAYYTVTAVDKAGNTKSVTGRL